MSSPSRTKLATLLAGPVLFSLLSVSFTRAQIRETGTFTATRPCPAPRGINGQNPGNIQLTVNQTYEVIGFNNPNREYIQIKIPGATPASRWVSTNCGTFSGESPEPITEEPVSTLASLPPFFDEINNPVSVSFPASQKVDMTPPPPILTPFDQAILNVCGSMGTKVRLASFQRLLSSYPDVRQKLQNAVGGELRPGRNQPTEFIQDLTDIWFQRQGFEHIFCGEIDGPTKIGGLHFYGRYLQLQNENKAGRIPNNASKEEAIPNVLYTLGVRIKQGNRMVSDERKGYAYISNALEILLDATTAFKRQQTAQGACLYRVQDQETGQSFKAVFVKDRNAIITFYPDATPSGRDCR